MRELDILLVEDDKGDIALMREAMEIAGSKNRLHIVNDGAQALDFLKQRESFENVPRPDVVLLDLNLPKMDGQEVLHFIRDDEALKSIPVIMLTGSHDMVHVAQSYEKGANSYIIKPHDVERFVHVIQSVDLFWGDISVLPEQEKEGVNNG